jgi:uncharacterized protein (TIGR03083 family)
MTSPNPAPDATDAQGTDVALYALDALDDAEARTVETVLATDANAAAVEARLRQAAGTLAAAADGIEIAPPPGLRDRVLAAARAERPPTAADVRPSEPAELHRIHGELVVDLLRSLTAADWDAPVDPPEFAGWTVGDLVAHLATVQAYFAHQLGAAVADIPERDPANDVRTAAAITRHRRLTPADAIAELETCLAAVDDDVARAGDPADRPIVWWGAEATVNQILVVRAFELWVHAADIARAVGRPEPIPSAPSLRTMSNLATTLTPIMCEVAGTLAPLATGAWVRFDLTGPGGATHDIALDRGAPTPSGAPTATLAIGIVDYCRAVANRIDPDALPHQVSGDTRIAEAVIASLPVLATL